MKKVKAYFKMMITAVICFAMSLIPGKKKGQAVEMLTGGQAAGKGTNGRAFLGTNAGMQGVTESAAAMSRKNAEMYGQKVAADMQRFRNSNLPRHVSGPTVGPGDRRISSEKIIVLPVGLCEENVFVRELRLCGQQSSLKEDSG